MPHPAPGHHLWTESSGPTVFLAAINYFLPLEQPWCSSGEPALSFSQTTWLRQACWTQASGSGSHVLGLPSGCQP